MAKYLVVFRVRLDGGDLDDPPAQITVESNINCDPDELSKEIREKKDSLQNKGDRKCDNGEKCSVTVVQVLSL